MRSLYFTTILTAAFALPKIEFKISPEGSHVERHLAKIKDAPYVGLMRDDSGGISYHCGVTILAKYWLLTAARCVLWGSKPSTPTDILVWTGVDSIPSNITLHQVEEIRIHEKYLRNGVDYNLALIKLKNPLQLEDNRKPIPIIKPENEPKVGDILQIHGFPITLDRIVRPLTSVSMQVVERDLCLKKYSEINNLSSSLTICAQVVDHCTRPEICSFNFGDPATINGQVVGILTEEAVQNYPGIFTNLGHYYNWIINHIPELKEQRNFIML